MNGILNSPPNTHFSQNDQIKSFELIELIQQVLGYEPHFKSESWFDHTIDQIALGGEHIEYEI